MKTYLIIVLTLIFIEMSFPLSASTCSPPTSEQCGKLADAIIKETPTNVDITFNEKLFRKPMSEKIIRRMFEDSFTRTDGPKDKMNAEKRDQFEKYVQMNVERTIKEQEFGVNIRKRIWRSGNRRRIDRITIKPEEWNKEKTDFKTCDSDINSAYDGTFIVTGQTDISCYHAMELIEIRQRKKEQVDNDDLDNIINYHLHNLKWLVTDRQDSPNGTIYLLSHDKIENLSRTGRVNNAKLVFCPETNVTQTRERIELRDINDVPLTIFICDSNDYSRVYYTEVRMPSTEKPIYIRECNDFDSRGIPRNVTVTEVELDGSLKKKKIYEILDINTNLVISDDVFEFSPPEDYEIVEVDPNGARKIIKGKGGIAGAMQILLKAQKEKDIATLNNLLGNEIWQIRLRSLQVLEHILTEDSEALKEVATALKNDENQIVREKSQSILNRIDRLKSAKPLD